MPRVICFPEKKIGVEREKASRFFLHQPIFAYICTVCAKNGNQIYVPDILFFRCIIRPFCEFLTEGARNIFSVMLSISLALLLGPSSTVNAPADVQPRPDFDFSL